MINHPIFNRLFPSQEEIPEARAALNRRTPALRQGVMVSHNLSHRRGHDANKHGFPRQFSMKIEPLAK
jgi:hypothetical protein